MNRSEPLAPLSGRRSRPSVAARLAMFGVQGYRWVFSARPSPCRFDPTCSQYALDAYAGHGFFRGSWLTARRIGRCRPGGGQGYDPVPLRTDQSGQGKS